MEQQKNSQRRPSGFSNAGQAPKRKSAAPATAQKEPEKKSKIKKEKPDRKPVNKKAVLKWMPIGSLIAVLAALILIIIFGNHGTYHQMPTITREETEPSFAPEEMPVSGFEEEI